MKPAITTHLVQSHLGRIALHFLCLLRGGALRWHLTGILRELRKAPISTAPLSTRPICSPDCNCRR